MPKKAIEYCIYQENYKGDDYIGRKITVNPSDRLGEINTNTYGTPMKIIRYGSYEDIDIEFLDEFHYIKEHQSYGNFKNGGVRNPYDKTAFGVGYAGVGEYLLTDVKPTVPYKTWYQVMNRCYNKKQADKRPAYVGIVTACSEWLNYQNFAKWWYENYYEIDERLDVDKDILVKGNKEYHPDKCLLVPQRINLMFTSKPNRYGLPTGVTLTANKQKYRARYNGKELGVFNTVEEAELAHDNEKRKHIREVAEEYRNKIPVKVYDALMNW